MAQQEREKRDISELTAICEDLFQKYASAEPGCSTSQQSAAQQQQRFSTIAWALFTHSETSLDLDVIRPLALRQIDAIRTRLEFAALHDTQFHSRSDILSSLKDIQRLKWIRKLEGTPSEALDVVKDTIDRLEQLGNVILQHLDSEVPTDTRDTSLKSIPGASTRHATGKVVTKTLEPKGWSAREKDADKKQAHVSSKASAPSRQISSDDSAIDMGNDSDQNCNRFNRPCTKEGQTVKSKVQKAKGLFQQRKYKEAEEHYRKILKEHSKCMEDDTSSIILVDGNLANALAKQGRDNEAEVLYEKVWKLSNDTYGETSAQALACKSNLASIWEKQGMQRKAVRMYREVLNPQKEAGARNVDTLSSSNKLANALMKQNEFVEATAIYKEMLGAHKEKYTEKDPKTIITLGNLVASLQNQGRSIEAKRDYLERMKLGLKCLDSEHPCRDWFETRYKELEGS